MDAFDETLICCFIFGCCEDNSYDNIISPAPIRNNINEYLVAFERPITDEATVKKNSNINEHMKRE